VQKLEANVSNATFESALADEYAVVLMVPESEVPPMQSEALLPSRELIDVVSLQRGVDSEDYTNIEFAPDLFTQKYDLLDYEYSIGGGLGVGAQAVNTSVVQWKLGSPFWGILPPVIAGTTLAYTILDNKDKQWQDRHKVAMGGFAKVITGVKFAGAFFFGQGIVLQIWPGDKFNLAAKLGVPGFALLLIIPIALLEEHKAIAKHPRVRGCAKKCISHAATVKIFEVISQGIGADGGMGSILTLVVGFQKLSTMNAVIIAASVGAANMLVEALPKDKYASIDGLKKLTDLIRTTVKAGALTAASLNLIFSIAAGASESHRVPDWVALISGGLLAITILPALGYRLYTYCSKPSAQQQQQLIAVADIADSDDLEAAPKYQQQLSLAKHPLNFHNENNRAVLQISHVPADTDALLPKVVAEQSTRVEKTAASSSGCNIL
jgi:hypothetical protein